MEYDGAAVPGPTTTAVPYPCRASLGARASLKEAFLGAEGNCEVPTC